METGFFKYLWRFNAVAIGFAAIGVIGICLVVAVELIEDVFRDVRSRAVVNIDATDPTVSESFSTSGFEAAGETGLYRYAIIRTQTYDIAYSSKTTENNIMNYGFVDPDTGEAHWLLNEFGALILWDEALSRMIGEGDDAVRRTSGHLYFMVREDTTDDRRLSASDKGTLVVTRPDGTGLVELLGNIDGVQRTMPYDEDTEIVIFRDGNETKALIVSLTTLAVEKTLDLPLPPI